MVTLTEKAEQWPRRKNHEIIFKTTHHAIFYANLIASNKRLVDEIDLWRRQARRELQAERLKPVLNHDRLMEIAVKSQFFRECLEEVKRIHEEH